MRRGEQVEQNTVHKLFAEPQHPYTQALLAAVPRLEVMADQRFPAKFSLPDGGENGVPQDTGPANAPPILRLEHLVTRFDLRRGILNRVIHQVHAVENVSFDPTPVKRWAWWANLVAANPLAGVRC